MAHQPIMARVLAAGLPMVAVLLASCASIAPFLSGDGGSGDQIAMGALHVHPALEPLMTGSRRPDGVRTVMTLNVSLDEGGIAPSVLSLPAGMPVRLVVRNRGAQGHHFHVQGVKPSEMLWLAKDFESGSVIQVGGEDHLAHHSGQMLPQHICTSRTGLCPTGLDVHAHAGPGEIDIIEFTATEPGIYLATCPLHPGMQSRVVVF